MAEVLDCPFCELSSEPESPFDINESIGEGYASLMPPLGMLVPGYFLTVTREHLTSFAQLERRQLRELDERLQTYEYFLSRVFGNYFRLEHGSDNVTACGSGGCVEHAHQHLVPGDDIVGRIETLLPWQKLDSYEDLVNFRGGPYIYLGRLGTHFVVSDPKLPGQWLRRQIASARGLPEWDWALDSGTANLYETFKRLGESIQKLLLE